MSLGFFDLLTPALTAFDVWLESFVPLVGRLLIWSLISAAISLWIFKILSNPGKSTAIKVELKATQKELNNHDGEFSELKQLALKSIALSLKRIRVTLFPAIISMLPIIFILVFLSNRFDFQTPQSGDLIQYTVDWQNPGHVATVSWLSINSQINTEVLTWPSEGDAFELVVNGKSEGVTVPISLVPMIHKKQWWNMLFANPAGYLSDESLLSSIHFEFKPQEPGKLLGKYFDDWKWPYFIMVFIFSIVIIFTFKVKF